MDVQWWAVHVVTGAADADARRQSAKAEIDLAAPLRFRYCFPSLTMAPPTSLSSHERTRVEDYLNDKIQVSADLESLDTLLSSLRAQQELQRKQVLHLPHFVLNPGSFRGAHDLQNTAVASRSTGSAVECDQSI